MSRVLSACSHPVVNVVVAVDSCLQAVGTTLTATLTYTHTHTHLTRCCIVRQQRNNNAHLMTSGKVFHLMCPTQKETQQQLRERDGERKRERRYPAGAAAAVLCNTRDKSSS